MQRAPPNAVSEVEMEQQTMPTPATLLLANDSPSIFREGFYTPSVTTFGTSQQGLPWKSVRSVVAAQFTTADTAEGMLWH